jgi:hypothetical protein
MPLAQERVGTVGPQDAWQPVAGTVLSDPGCFLGGNLLGDDGAPVFLKLGALLSSDLHVAGCRGLPVDVVTLGGSVLGMCGVWPVLPRRLPVSCLPEPCVEVTAAGGPAVPLFSNLTGVRCT